MSDCVMSVGACVLVSCRVESVAWILTIFRLFSCFSAVEDVPAESLDAELRTLMQMQITDSVSVIQVKARAEELCVKYDTSEQQAQILFKVALLHVNGHKFPAESLAAVDAALSASQPLERKLQLLVYRGDALSLQAGDKSVNRRQSAAAYRDGLLLCVESEAEPVSPASSRSVSDVSSLASRLKQFRETFERQLAWTYHTSDSNLNELQSLLADASVDAATVERILTAAKALRPAPAPGGLPPGPPFAEPSSNPDKPSQSRNRRWLLTVVNVVIAASLLGIMFRSRKQT